MKEGQISASMMCSDLLHLKENITLLEKNHIEYLHIDVMDGSFVPNFGLGTDFVKGLRLMTNIPMDIHFMVNQPEIKMDYFEIKEEDRVHFHYESTQDIKAAIERARRYGCRVMLAISPETPVSSIENMLSLIDGITVLTVYPGFAGQKIVESCIVKTEELKKTFIKYGLGKLDIEVDGNINPENARKLRSLGANIFVAGSSSIFPCNGAVSEQGITQMREAIT